MAIRSSRNALVIAAILFVSDHGVRAAARDLPADAIQRSGDRQLTGDVYYARMDDYLSVFMVTPDGIVLVEPIGTEFATWLKGELASRFKVPVKYVIYSHHHWDHGSGASVYADTARIIGHEAMMKRLAMPPAIHRRRTSARRTRTATAASSRARRRATSRPSSRCMTRESRRRA